MWKFVSRLAFAVLTTSIGGCTGCTTDATSITTTSARLNATGICESGDCDVHFRVWAGEDTEAPPLFDTAVLEFRGMPADTEGDFFQDVSGLGEYARYSFRACGKEAAETEFECANTRHFTVALPAPAVSEFGIVEVTPSARLYSGDELSFAGSPHGSASQQDAITFHDGYFFVVFYDENHRVSLARRHYWNDTSWTTITFSEIVPPTGDPDDEDTHDTPNVAISPNDGRVHLAYGHHVDDLRYRISVAGAATATVFDASLFSAERDSLNAGGSTIERVTYPIFATRESDDQLFLFWREGSSGKGDILMADYEDDGTWSTPRKIIDGLVGTYVDPTGTYGDSSDRNPYLNDVATFGDQLHLSWCWREKVGNGGSPLPNHDLMFAASGDAGVVWHNTAGTVIRDGAALPAIHLDSDGILVQPIDYGSKLINSGSTAIDSLGNTHVVVRHAQDTSGTTPQRYWHYARVGDTWTGAMVGDADGPFAAGRRPKIFIDRTTDTLYVAAVVAGKARIYAAQRTTDNGDGTVSPDWSVWTHVYTGSVSYQNEFNGRLIGNSLILLGQRVGATETSVSSPLEILWLLLDSDPVR